MINWTRIEELKNEIGEDTFAEIAELFLDEVDSTVAQLRAGQLDAPLQETMHFLKGCALNLGFADFGKLCLRKEKAAETDSDLTDVLQCYDQSRAEFIRGAFPNAPRSQIQPISDHR